MARNPALETKVKALKGKLLTDQNYLKLIDEENLAGVIDLLKESSHFSDELADINDSVSRTILEEQFSHIVVSDADKILYFVHQKESDFIKLVIQRINLSSLLILIRAIAKRENLKELGRHLVFSKEFDTPAFTELIETGSFDSFKKALRGTIYYRSIETYSDLTPENLFEIERTMERRYFDLMYQIISKNDSKENQSLIRCLRTEIDLLNLIWIYRAKKFYRFKADQIIPFILRGGLRVNEDNLKRLAEIDSYDRLLEELRKFKEYEFLFNHSEKDLDLHMNRRRKRFMYYQFKDLFFFGNGISNAYAYLQMLEYEISDIISIIEAKRYNLTKEETIKYLVRDF